MHTFYSWVLKVLVVTIPIIVLVLTTITCDIRAVTNYQDDGGLTFAFNTYDASINGASGSENTNDNDHANSIAGGTNYNARYLFAYPNLVGNGENQIPQGSTISSASITFTKDSAQRNTGNTIEVYRITRNWNPIANESLVTWNNYDGVNSWTTPGGDISATPVATYTFSTDSPDTITIDMTNAVQELVSGTYPNYGWLVKYTGSETNSPYIQVRSRNHAGTSYRPILSITVAENPPSTPSTLLPVHEAVDIEANPVLSWESNYATSYDIYLGTSSDPEFFANTTSDTFTPQTLLYSTVYYWKVVAKNDLGESQSTIQSFVTKSHATYYVDQINGDNSNDGLSPETPWKTISKVNSSSFGGGDSILFKKGDVWNERLEITWSGSSDNYLRFGSYGSGALPVFDGATTGLWVGITDYYSSYDLGWIIIDGFEIRNYISGIDMQKTSNIIIRNSKVHSGGGDGSGLISVSGATGGEIFNNEVFGNTTQNGIWISGNSTNLYVYNNESYNNGTNGIGLSYSSNNFIFQNKVWANSQASPQYSGIGIEVNSNGNKVYNNISYENIHSGLVINGSNNQIIHNTIANNDDYQIILTDWEGSAPINNILKNNIFVSKSGERAIAFFDSETAGSWDDQLNIFDYNLYFLPGAQSSSYIIGLDRNYTFDEWRNVASMEAHGFFANPLFVNSSTGDFHLLEESPAINIGENLLLANDFEGNLRPSGSTPDIGAFEFLIVDEEMVAPNIPVVQQYKQGNLGVINPGQWINSSSIVLRLTISSNNSSDILIPEVEIRKYNTDFINSPTHTAPNVEFSGSPAEVNVIVSGLETNSSYHWRARVSNSVGSSQWVSLGGNPDFRVDLTPPKSEVISIVNSNESKSVEITLGCNDLLGSGCEKIFYTIDGSSPTVNSNFGSKVILDKEGRYTLRYFSLDRAQNSEPINTYPGSLVVEKVVSDDDEDEDNEEYVVLSSPVIDSEEEDVDKGIQDEGGSNNLLVAVIVISSVLFISGLVFFRVRKSS